MVGYRFVGPCGRGLPSVLCLLSSGFIREVEPGEFAEEFYRLLVAPAVDDAYVLGEFPGIYWIARQGLAGGPTNRGRDDSDKGVAWASSEQYDRPRPWLLKLAGGPPETGDPMEHTQRYLRRGENP